MRIKFKFYVFVMFYLITADYSLGQVVTKTSTSPVSGTVCPNISTYYEVSRPTGFGACKITWSATNGKITSGNGLSTVIVEWADTPGGKGKVTATFSDCGNTNDGKTASLEELILSVKGQSFGTYNNSVNIDYCVPANVTLQVPKMYVQGTGGIDQPPLQEVIYAWTLPSGWTTYGSLNTAENLITIFPAKCAVPGIVKVEGVIIDRCGSAGLSAPATINLTGSQPSVTVTAPGFTGVTACNTTPVTFYASTTGGCLNNYTWTYPSSWTRVGETANSITLSPSGKPADEGAIRAAGNFTCGSSVQSPSYIPQYKDPVVTGPGLVCSSETYTIENAEGLNIGWSSSNTSILTINSSGVASRYSTAYGQVTINATLPCAAPVTPKTIYVGIPQPPGTMTGPTSPNIGYTERYLVTIPALGASSHEWILPYNRGCTDYCWSIYRYNAPTDIFVKVGSTSGWMQLRGINACGTGGVSKLYITPTGSGGCNPCEISEPHPNPAKNELLVQFNRERADSIMNANRSKSTRHKPSQSSFDFEIEYNLQDENGEQVLYYQSRDRDPKLDLTNVKNGVYILTIQYASFGTDQHRIIVSK